MKITTIVSLAIGLAGWQATVQARDAVPQTRKGASPAVAQASPDGNMVLIPASQARDIQRATREVSDCVRIVLPQGIEVVGVGPAVEQAVARKPKLLAFPFHFLYEFQWALYFLSFFS